MEQWLWPSMPVTVPSKADAPGLRKYKACRASDEGPWMGPTPSTPTRKSPKRSPSTRRCLCMAWAWGGKWMRGAARHLAVTHEQAQVHRQATQTQGQRPIHLNHPRGQGRQCSVPQQVSRTPQCAQGLGVRQQHGHWVRQASASAVLPKHPRVLPIRGRQCELGGAGQCCIGAHASA